MKLLCLVSQHLARERQQAFHRRDIQGQLAVRTAGAEIGARCILGVSSALASGSKTHLDSPLVSCDRISFCTNYLVTQQSGAYAANNMTPANIPRPLLAQHPGLEMGSGAR